jgi:hypothetical protein
MNSRFILSIDGTPSVSLTNNSTVNIAGSPSASIDLGSLNSSISTPATCEFKVYGIQDTSNSTNVIFAPDNSSYLCSNGSNDGNGNTTDLPANPIFSFRDEFINGMNSSSTDATISNTTATFGTDVNGNYCDFVITGFTCPTFPFVDSSSGQFQFLTPSTTPTNGAPISPTFGSVSTPANPGAMQGINFTCGSSNISYGYNNFNVSFENDCSNHNKSFLIFTPQVSATGTQKLGSGSENEPFYIANIQNQNGDFYLNAECDTVSGNAMLATILENTILS